MRPPQSSYQYVFTVFTPTYNRAHTLHRVCESLKAQTFRDFEWLIVDDGSTDKTNELVKRWQEEVGFPIHYIYQENRGKHIAFMRGVQCAKGELFLNLDSDDACLPEALERFKYHWDSIPADQRAKFSAVTCLCRYQTGELVGSRFPFDPTDSDSLEIQYRFKVRGEKWGFHRTDVLKQFPFPEGIKRTYIPESLIWNKVARRYKTRFVNEALRIYWTAEPSMVHHQHPRKHAVGGRIENLTALNEEISWFRYAPEQFLRSAANYSRFSFHTGSSVLTQLGSLDNALARGLWIMVLPLGFFLYLRDMLRRKSGWLVKS